MFNRHSTTRQVTATVAVVLMLAAASVSFAQLPDPGMVIDPTDTALVITDPQNDFLSPHGVACVVVGKSVEANNTVQNPQVAEGDGYAAALVNFRFIAKTVWTTQEAKRLMQESGS